jgi:hypothetical protein
MTPYEVATMAMGVIITGIAWWNKVLWGEIKSLKEDIKKIPDTYARRDDLKDVEDKILRAIDGLSSKIDRILLGKHD